MNVLLSCSFGTTRCTEGVITYPKLIMNENGNNRGHKEGFNYDTADFLLGRGPVLRSGSRSQVGPPPLCLSCLNEDEIKEEGCGYYKDQPQAVDLIRSRYRHQYKDFLLVGFIGLSGNSRTLTAPRSLARFAEPRRGSRLQETGARFEYVIEGKKV